MKRSFLYCIITVLFAISFIDPVAGIAQNGTYIPAIALYPQQNAVRNRLDLSSIWNFQLDPAEEGENAGWFNGLPAPQSIAVPGSWNDQLDQKHNYLGCSWYEMETYVPSSWKNNEVGIRIGSAVYFAKVWINGQLLGQHEGGHLPFAFAVTDKVKWGEKNRITIMVENKLSADRVPGNVAGGALTSVNYPNTNYDFFPYSGLHRSVWLYSVPKQAHLIDIALTTTFQGSTGTIHAKVKKHGKVANGRVIVSDKDGKQTVMPLRFTGDDANVDVQIADVKLWSPDTPYLYNVTVELGNASKPIDSYNLQTGVRTIEVKGNDILLNGEPIILRGFGKHEDFPIFGRGTALPVMIRDFSLMKWIGANSFRTSHYPYDETVYEEADKQGILIIDEIPSVGLVFYDDKKDIDRRRKLCDRMLEEMITRDKNHPSVIMWCVANEPSPKTLGSNVMGGSNDAAEEENNIAKDFLGGLLRQAKKLDPSRLTTFVGVMGGPADWMAECDLITINRYYGWYTNTGNFAMAERYFGGELDKLYNQFHKPIVLTEFGADAISGHHANEDEMYSEEFQRKMINAYLDIANTKPFVKGMMVWAFADFRTGQALMRVGGMNLKGVFTQDRRPKMAAWLLRKRWVDEKKGNF
ncbi:MAG: beta-glucuronidase [Bacteroidaceae bacterium]|nr:beta-glucuronidase [Bacteroidaceae bacterium]